MRRSLQEAANHLLKRGRIDAAAHQKYFLSLTEQEIVRGLPEYDKGDETNASASPPSGGKDAPQAIAFLREFADGGRGLASTKGYIEQHPLLDALKERIKRVLPDDCIATATATFDQNGKLDEAYLSDFATAIQRKLEAAIDRHIALVSAIEQAPDFALQSEREEHHAFAVEKRKFFVGRGDNLAAIASYITLGGHRPLILHGRSGLGKSALMASAIVAAEAAAGAPVIYRFIGASAASADYRSLLISLVEDLAAHGIAQKPDEFEQDANKFCDQIKSLLSAVTKPVVIFLDALDQLRKPFRVSWLPDKLPKATKLVVSVLDDEAYHTDSGIYRGLRQRLAPDAFLEIEPLASIDARKILTELESNARCRLQGRQRDYIIRQFEAAGGSPFYLRTAFEIARSWRSSDTAGKGHQVLAEDTTALIAQFIRDLSVAHHHQPELVTRTLGYLTAAKDGLSAKELADVLSRDQRVIQAISSEKYGARTDKLPASVWVRLNRQLAPFLREKRIDDQPLLQFFHRQVAEVARSEHYEKIGGVKLHEGLADYFESRGLKREGGADYDKRSLSEIPYQLHHAQRAARADKFLMSPDWMQQKVMALGPRALIEDYQYAHTTAHDLIKRVLELVARILTRDPRQLLPQLLGRLGGSNAAGLHEMLQICRQMVTGPALMPHTSRFTAPGAELLRFEGHSDSVRAVAVVRGKDSVISASADRTLRLWDLRTGAELRCFTGHAEEVTAVAVLPDGNHAISASADTTLRLWDLNSGEELRRYEGHSDKVHCLAISSSGDRFISGSEDKTMSLWNVTSGKEVRRFRGHEDAVTSVAITEDAKKIISASPDRTIRVWGIDTAAELIRVKTPAKKDVPDLFSIPDMVGAYDGPFTALAILPDGEHVVSTALQVAPEKGEDGDQDDETGHETWLQISDIRTGAIVRQFARSEGPVTSVVVSPDGSHLVAGFSKRPFMGMVDPGTWNLEYIKIFDWRSGDELKTLKGHEAGVNALAVLPNGHQLISASDDQTIRLWSLDPALASNDADEKDRTVSLMALMADGKTVLRARHLGAFDIIQAEERGGSTRIIGSHRDFISAIVGHPDGSRVLSSSIDGTLRTWALTTGKELNCFRGDQWITRALAVMPSGEEGILYSKDESELRVFDIESGRKMGRISTGEDRITALAPLSDGKCVTGSEDGTLYLRDIVGGTIERRYVGHTGGITGVASLSDSHFISAAGDWSLRLWNVEQPQPLARMDGDAPFDALIPIPNTKAVWARDRLGRVHLVEALTSGSSRGDNQRFVLLDAKSNKAPRSQEQDALTAHVNQGDTFLMRDELNEALDSYREGLMLAEQQAAKDTDRPEWQQELSNILEKIGKVLQRQENTADALSIFRRRHLILERLSEIDGSHPDGAYDLLVSHFTLGMLSHAEGDSEGTLASYKAALVIAQKWATSDSNKAERNRVVSVILGQIADVLREEGHSEDAMISYKAALAVAKRLTADRDFTQLQNSLAVSLVAIGDEALTADDLSTARDSYEVARETFAHLAESDAQFANWDGNLSIALQKLGDVALALGNTADALTNRRKALAISERLLAQDPTNTERQYGQGLSLNRLGDVLLAQDDLGGALDSYRASSELFEGIASSNPENTGWQRALGASYGQQGQVLAKMKRVAEALNMFRKARTIFGELEASLPGGGSLRDTIEYFDEQIGALQG